jgi:hypothetical protein
LYQYGKLNPLDNVLTCLDSHLFSPDRVMHVVYIDDCGQMGLDPVRVNHELDRCMAAYRAAGFPINDKKTERASVVVQDGSAQSGSDGDGTCLLGLCFGMRAGEACISVARDKLMSLWADTVRVLSAGAISGLHLSELIGRWTWAMLVRRPSLSALRHVYRFIAVAGRRVYVLWPGVRRELIVLCGLLPLLSASLSAPLYSRVLASDASSSGGGVVAARMDESSVNLLLQVGAKLRPGAGLPFDGQSTIESESK